MTRLMERSARSRGRVLALVVALSAACAVFASLVAAAPAAAMPGSASFFTGFVEDPLLLEYPPPASVPSDWFDRMFQLRSSWARIGVYWNDIAPAHPPAGFHATDPGDPNYSWWYLDKAVRDATTSHQHILLTLSSPPAWALGTAPRGAQFRGEWNPNASAFGAFARAVARRYSGTFPDPDNPGKALPRVSDYQAWNEENLPGFLMPEWKRSGHGWTAVGPTVYRALLNALYFSVKAIQPGAFVIAGGLAPYGDPAGDGRMHPVTFLRGLLCLSSQNRPLPCPNPAHFDAIDIHPYGLTPTSRAFNPFDVGTPDVGRLIPLLQAAERTGRALPRRAKPIWATEIDWDSSPPDRSGVPLARQAQYLSLSFYELWNQGVNHVLWFEPRDMANSGNALTGFGLYFENERPKPATIAFRFPFVALPAGQRMVTLWGRAPAAGLVTIEQLHGGRWRPVARVGSTGGGVFYARRRLGSHLTLRARVGNLTSYPYPTG